MRQNILCLFFLIHIVSFAQSDKLYKYEKPLKGDFFSQKDIVIKTRNSEISGTLTVPNADFNKLLIFVPGSGQDKRNNHFKLAEQLVSDSTAVFRFDDRGVGKSTGNFTAGIEGFDDDLLKIYRYFKDDKSFSGKKIGILAHSLGGLITLKAMEKGLDPDLLVFLAVPDKGKGYFFEYQSSLSYYQSAFAINNEHLTTSTKMIAEINEVIANRKNDSAASIAKAIDSYFADKGIKNYNKMYISDWYIDLAKQEFSECIKNIKVPVLWCFAGHDSKIETKTELQALSALGNPLITTHEFPGLNHYFYWGAGKSLYDMQEDVSLFISSWIKNK
jgi:pimeloyl-ACP methyl ester carboxylesterase